MGAGRDLFTMKSDRDVKQWAFVAASEGRKRALDLAKKISASNCAVLIMGPTGVGKDILAEDIHVHSSRAAGRFVAINCAALSPALFESELFGHDRGAYTGAVTRKIGLVELADRGTLFLDEIGELPLHTQAKLLRFLSRGTFWPLGSTAERVANVRVIAATNRDLRAMLPSSFREDLFYRLSVVTIVLPPLAADDARLIVSELVREIARQEGYATNSHEISALSSLAASSSWPGGVRQLRSALHRYFILRQDAHTVSQNWQRSSDLGASQPFHPTGEPKRARRLGDAGALLKHFEVVVFLELAREADGVRDLAQRLDRTPQAVYDRLRKLGLSPSDLGTDKLVMRLVEARNALAPYHPWIQALLMASSPLEQST